MKVLFSGVIFYIKKRWQFIVVTSVIFYVLTFKHVRHTRPANISPANTTPDMPSPLKQDPAGSMRAGMSHITSYFLCKRKRQQSYISLLPMCYCNLSAFFSAHSKIASNASCRQNVGSIVSSPSVFPSSATFQTINVVM